MRAPQDEKRLKRRQDFIVLLAAAAVGVVWLALAVTVVHEVVVLVLDEIRTGGVL